MPEKKDDAPRSGEEKAAVRRPEHKGRAIDGCGEDVVRRKMGFQLRGPTPWESPHAPKKTPPPEDEKK